MRSAEVEAAGDDLDDRRATPGRDPRSPRCGVRLPASSVGRPTRRRATTPGVWLPTDDPRVPEWLHPFNGDVLVAFERRARGGGRRRPQAARPLRPRGRRGHRGGVSRPGLARRLVTQAARRILADGAVPVYLHAPDNVASARTADASGFPDVGWRILGLFGGDGRRRLTCPRATPSTGPPPGCVPRSPATGWSGSRRPAGGRSARGRASSIDDVEARGKHLLVHFGGGLTLRTHMRMTGSWHLYEVGERWRKGAHLARARGRGRQRLGGGVLPGAGGRDLPPRRRRAARARRPRSRPDRGPIPTSTLAVARVATHADPGAEVADVLLDQRVASRHRQRLQVGGPVPPRPRSVHAASTVVGADRLHRIYATAHELLRANLDRSHRVTYRNGVAVYGRRGQPCLRCGTSVRDAAPGPDGPLHLLVSVVPAPASRTRRLPIRRS